ncbi:MAG: hypothetical protein J0I06_22050 [Planctomycetes bacterium]|nr:hypothetical protein [Planctomycetota bacterium]
MKKSLAAAVAAFAFALLIGCRPTVATTPATPPSNEKDRDVHIRTPGASVDVEGKGKDRKVDVDVHRKDKNP